MMRCNVLINGKAVDAELIGIEYGHAKVRPDGTDEVFDVLTYQVGKAWKEGSDGNED